VTGLGPYWGVIYQQGKFLIEAAFGLFNLKLFWTICCAAIAYLRDVAAGVPALTAGSTLIVLIDIV
jgi:hypothetical protein